MTAVADNNNATDMISAFVYTNRICIYFVFAFGIRLISNKMMLVDIRTNTFMAIKALVS